MRKNFLLSSLLIMTLVLALMFTGCGDSSGGEDVAEPTEQATTYSMGSVAAEGSVMIQSANMFADKVKEYTDGAVIINVFPASQLGSDESMAEDLARGNLDFAMLNPSSCAGLDPMMDCHFLPFIATNYEEADKLFYGGGVIQQTLTKTLANHNIKVLAWYENEFRGLSNSKKVVKSAADVAGLKLRVPGSTAVKDFFTELDAQPVVMAMGDLYTSLQQGTVDGQDNGPIITHDNNLEENNKNYTYTKHVYSMGTYVVSDATWAKLSAEQQEAILKAAKEAQEWQVPATRALIDSYLKEMADEGVAIYEMTDEDIESFVKVATRTWDNMRSVYGDEYIDALIKEINEVRGN